MTKATHLASWQCKHMKCICIIHKKDCNNKKINPTISFFLIFFRLPSSYSVTSELLILWYTTASSARFLYLLFSRRVLFSSCCDFSICPWVRLLLANVCNKWEFWSCTWQVCIRWMALDYVIHDEGPQSLKSNFYHKTASALKTWFIIVNCFVFNLRFALNVLKTTLVHEKRKC